VTAVPSRTRRGLGNRSEHHPRIRRGRTPCESEAIPDAHRVPPGSLGRPRDLHHPGGIGVLTQDAYVHAIVHLSPSAASSAAVFKRILSTTTDMSVRLHRATPTLEPTDPRASGYDER
jgi:hypothetical protein